MNVNTIVCMDALEFMRGLADSSVDAVIADPPYGVGKVSHARPLGERFEEIIGNDRVSIEWIKEAYRVQKNKGGLYVFAKWQNFAVWQNAIADAGYSVRNCIVWDKMQRGMGDIQTTYAPQHELILFAAKGWHTFKNGRPADIIRIPKIQPEKLKHPYEKPVSLIQHLIINSTKPDAIILDPFVGSGATCDAARRLGRHYIGCDLDPHWAEYAQRRLAQSFTPDMFDALPSQDDKPVPVQRALWDAES